MSNAQTVKHPVIFAMMNIRNEDRWLREVLDSAARVCDGIIVYDDGSTDKTLEICQLHPAVFAFQQGIETETDKARDKNRMYTLALEHKFDWMLCIDGDEVWSRPRRNASKRNSHLPAQRRRLISSFISGTTARTTAPTESIRGFIIRVCSVL
ncbi:MAG: glycosyltransferase family 2 protein [bacterium]|nr:glycosyltransferase family 2 protein [bacterium]